MKRRFFLIFTFLFFIYSLLAGAHDVKVYLLPGQGSDYRLYSKFVFPEDYTITYIELPVPAKKASMRDYALQISRQIDTTGYTILIGTSLGGMICTELNHLWTIEKTILISSAKNRNELPLRYRFQKYIPVYAVVPKRLIKLGTFIAQPLVEPDRKHNKDIFVSMLKDKNPVYLKRTIAMIVKWNNTSYNENIIHIHGDKDHTLPIRRIKYDFLIDHGSHVMTLTRGDEINQLITSVLIN